MQAVDTSVPSLARAYDYLLGGRANFVADRALARQWRDIYPQAGQLLRLSRTYVTGCCAQLSLDGVRQFIDVGSGLPTAPSLHAAVARSGARVVYVDRDPAVVAHARAVVPPGPVSVVPGDLLEPEALLWALRPLVDLAQPACLVLGLVIQALPDLGTARAVVDVLVRALAPGSHWSSPPAPAPAAGCRIRSPRRDCRRRTWRRSSPGWTCSPPGRRGGPALGRDRAQAGQRRPRMMDQVAPGVFVATSPVYLTTTTIVVGAGGGCLLIDPALTAAELAGLGEWLAGAGLRPAVGWATHPHWDHVLWSRSLGTATPRAMPRPGRSRPRARPART